MYRKLACAFFIMYDKLTGRRVWACKNFLEKTQYLKKRELQRLQIKKLKALLTHAYAHVPYYHELFKNAGFRPEDLREVEDLRKIPILSRSALRKYSKKIIADNFAEKNMILQFTSGTTASPVGVYRSKEDLSWGVAAELRAYSWAGYKVGDRKALIWLIRPEDRRSFRFKLRNLLLRTKILDVNCLSEKSMESFVRVLHRFKPKFIRGYPSSTSILAAFMLNNGCSSIKPKAVFTSGQTLLPNYRRVIEKAFGCKVYDYYASSEMSHIAAQCGQHEGLHVSDENIIVEVVKSEETTSRGEDGKILLTNLNNYAMPFIRYDIGDVGKILNDECSCGRDLTLLQVSGRTYEYFQNSDGSFTCLRDFQTVFEDLPIRDFQVIQETFDEILIKIVAEPGYTNAHTEFILRNIKSSGKANIKIELVDSLPLGASGKVQHLVSKLKTNYT
jgi:phenylacetate-CoA ligase